MKLSEVYFEAAQKIVTEAETSDMLHGDDKYAACCDAIICGADFDLRCEALRNFERWFCPEFLYDALWEFWWANPTKTDEDQEARRLALLFMYHITKDEER